MGAGTFNQPTPGYGQQPAQAQATSGKATTSLVLGIIALVLFVLWVPVVLGPLAIVFGVMARNEIARDPTKSGHGLATAGIVCGISGMVLLAVIAVIGFTMT